jgi:hypothetical protein
MLLENVPVLWPDSSLKKQGSHGHDEECKYMNCWTAKSISPSAETTNDGDEQLTRSLDAVEQGVRAYQGRLVM